MEFAQRRAADVHLVERRPHRRVSRLTPTGLDSKERGSTSDRASEWLTEFARSTERSGVRVHNAALPGDPPEAIAGYAQLHSASLDRSVERLRLFSLLAPRRDG